MASVQLAMLVRDGATLNQAIDAMGLFLNQYRDSLRVELVMEVRKEVSDMMLQQRSRMDAVLKSHGEDAKEEREAFSRKVVQKVEEIDQRNKKCEQKAELALDNATYILTQFDSLEKNVRINHQTQLKEWKTRDQQMKERVEYLEESVLNSESDAADQTVLMSTVMDRVDTLQELCKASQDQVLSHAKELEQVGELHDRKWGEMQQSHEERVQQATVQLRSDMVEKFEVERSSTVTHLREERMRSEEAMQVHINDHKKSVEQMVKAQEVRDVQKEIEWGELARNNEQKDVERSEEWENRQLQREVDQAELIGKLKTEQTTANNLMNEKMETTVNELRREADRRELVQSMNVQMLNEEMESRKRLGGAFVTQGQLETMREEMHRQGAETTALLSSMTTRHGEALMEIQRRKEEGERAELKHEQVLAELFLMRERTRRAEETQTDRIDAEGSRYQSERLIDERAGEEPGQVVQRGASRGGRSLNAPFETALVEDNEQWGHSQNTGGSEREFECQEEREASFTRRKHTSRTGHQGRKEQSRPDRGSVEYFVSPYSVKFSSHDDSERESERGRWLGSNCWSHPHFSKPVEYPTNRNEPGYGLRRLTERDKAKLITRRDAWADGSFWPPKE